MRLTSGISLLARARRLALMVQDTSRELQECASGLHGTIRIGCVPTLAQHLMPLVLQADNGDERPDPSGAVRGAFTIYVPTGLKQRH